MRDEGETLVTLRLVGKETLSKRYSSMKEDVLMCYLSKSPGWGYLGNS